MKFLTSPNISTNHGFFGRGGGVSDGIYGSLNASYGSNDDVGNITQNRHIIATHFGVQASHLLTLKQTHSNICHVVNDASDMTNIAGDALATNKRRLVLGVLTADCAPILLHDAKAGVIAAAHAGWKGALGGIIEATIEAMQSLGANIANIHCAVGASIAQCSYEVEQDFADYYIRKNQSWQKFFISSPKSTKLLFDNKAFIAEKLAHIGIKNVEIFPHDTYAMQEYYFSFRRATHAGEADYGRQISAIML